MPLIDTHCHLDFDTFDENRDAIVQAARDAGVTRLINPGVDLDRSRAAIALADRYPGVYAAVGIHPTSTAEFSDAMLDEVRALADHPKVVAIGEIGLDYHWDDSPPDMQRTALEAQLTLAAALSLPVIIHNREASEDVIDVLAAWIPSLPPELQDRPGVLHSFSAPEHIADRALELGFYLGFTGPITFKNADELRHIAAKAPGDRILVETDSPFLTPHPYRGRRPNQPAYVRFVAERLAALRQVSDEAFAAQSTANAERLFALPPDA
ncbi:MAG TPA: TatD family hydrolase [Aggregatilinea sp.]|uniref:TatD family hydrolase n=1 Tax=Aggregatilinea sp. TaxID=2806333 RepID=UPI002CB6831B|nr:TatD family hydrolase [Aggregatilinea sp.]HML25052.1 TatD family hydrolase [Aggregatilinea sp.]